MKLYTEKVFEAINFAYTAHKDVLDKSGVPYIFHPAYLASQMDTEEEIITALLHDVVEDTPITLWNLSNRFSQTIVDAVDALTHREGEPYFDYIQRVKCNPIATKVKLADLRHNGNPTRTILPKYIKTGIEKRIARYAEAIEILEQEF